MRGKLRPYALAVVVAVAAASAALPAQAGAPGSSDSTEGNDVVPILSAIHGEATCAQALRSKATLAGQTPFRQALGRVYQGAVPAAQEYVVACVARGGQDVIFASSRQPHALMQAGSVGAIAAELTRLARAQKRHEIYLVGEGSGAEAALRIARQLPKSVVLRYLATKP